MAGGVLANQAIHHMDLLDWWLLRLTPQSVFAYETRSGDHEVEDILVGVVRFDYGAVGSIEVTAAARPQDLEGSITVLGTKGVVKVGGFAVNKMELWQFEDEQPEDAEIRTHSENPPDVYGFGHRAFYKHVLINCLRDRMSTEIDGRTSLRLVTALYESVEQHSEIYVGATNRSNRLGYPL